MICRPELPNPAKRVPVEVMQFQLKADYKPTGDQPQAIETLVRSLRAGDRPDPARRSRRSRRRGRERHGVATGRDPHA